MTEIEMVSKLVADHMDQILSYFKPGKKITVLVRSPDNPDGDFCLTNDDLTEVTAMIARRLAAGVAIMEVDAPGSIRQSPPAPSRIGSDD
ncbi:hypothetical protein I2750_19565 [Bacillus sp. PR5]|nr:hypothetical protein [Bacillus sp. PR5]